MSRLNADKTNRLRELFDILGDRTRFQLVQRMIKRCDNCVSELAEELGMTTAGASQQLKILEQAGIFKRIRKGQKICFELNSEDSDISQIVKLIKQRED